MYKLIPFESDETRKLRFDIVELSNALTIVETEIDEFHRCIYAFDREYQNRLGDLAEAVLALRIELGMADEQPQYNEVNPVLNQLADPEYQLLKSAFRQAAKLCHPDHLIDEHRGIGLHLFDALNKAYHLQDLVTVEHILWLLESGQAFSETALFISNVDLLERQHELLTYLIEQKKDQLSQLRIREEYDVSNRDNWNIILYDYQTNLEDELAILRSRVNHANR